jgi:hypothetical protein
MGEDDAYLTDDGYNFFIARQTEFYLINSKWQAHPSTKARGVATRKVQGCTELRELYDPCASAFHCRNQREKSGKGTPPARGIIGGANAAPHIENTIRSCS